MPTDNYYKKIFQSEYGNSRDNFHISRKNDVLMVELTYPPWTDADNKSGKIRYVYIDQESVRASDGIRVNYDYERDGFVVAQPKMVYVPVGDNQMDAVEEWIEVGFFPSWRFEKEEGN